MALSTGGIEYQVAPISAGAFVERREAGRLVGRPSSFAGLELLIEDGAITFLTAETPDGLVLGHVGVNSGPSVYEPLQKITGERHGIGALAVAERFRRQRVGMHLMFRSLNLLADEGHDAFLAVQVDNAPAISLYENMGFQRRGELYLPHDTGVGKTPVWQDKLCDVMVYDYELPT